VILDFPFRYLKYNRPLRKFIYTVKSSSRILAIEAFEEAQPDFSIFNPTLRRG
jgi:hypothetical protein